MNMRVSLQNRNVCNGSRWNYILESPLIRPQRIWNPNFHRSSVISTRYSDGHATRRSITYSNKHAYATVHLVSSMRRLSNTVEANVIPKKERTVTNESKKKAIKGSTKSTSTTHTSTSNSTTTGANKRSNKETPESFTNWRTGAIEVAAVTPNPTTVTRVPDEQQQSLSPWLQQLWKGGTARSGSGIHSIYDGVEGSSTTQSATTKIANALIATSQPYALASPEILQNEESSTSSPSDDLAKFVDEEDFVHMEKLTRKRSGGSGNDFDGKGYSGDHKNGDDNDHEDMEDKGGGDMNVEMDETEDVDATTPNSGKINVDRVAAMDRTLIDPKDTWPIDPNLYPHLRTSLTDINVYDVPELLSRDTGLSICVLGTSAGGSCRLRSNTATVVRSGAYCYLIDAGEGVQRQFMLSRLRYNDIRKIFITHMHADHVFGISGLLLSLQMARLNETTPRPIEIYGPVGLYNYIAMSLALTCTELRKLKVFIYELHGGTQRSMRFSGNRKTFPEFQHKVRISWV
jgi:Metallo-beta-lactamase superfamily